GDKATDLARYYHVSRKTLYEVFHKAKLGVFANYSSKNLRYRTIEYGLKKLSKTEEKIEKKLQRQQLRLNRYRKDHPGEMVHTDSSVLPLVLGEAAITPKEYLYVFIDDYSRTLFADILPDQTSYSAAIVLDEAIEMMPFKVECIYSDNGSEFKGEFKRQCQSSNIPQQFTRPYRPQTNGKAERVIKTIKQLLRKHRFLSREERRRILYAIVRYYNHLRPHQSLGGIPPFECLKRYIEQTKTELRELNKSVTNA
ncbi:MAG: integrase core domain-containing protein, partial [Candidatus Gribaldobacteria bacterium]|nr:integrase core domain-containing protein [Candidatus Gribaldobacteria bacterium]